MTYRRLTPTVIIFPVLIVGILCLTIAAWFHISSLSQSQESRPLSPKFKPRQCLALNDREKWQPEVFAEILQVGEHNYLLDFSPYKRRSKFADIVAYTLPFEFVEESMAVARCPERRT